MKFKVKEMKITTGGALIAYLNSEDAKRMDIHSSDRIKIIRGKEIETAIVDIASSPKILKKGYVGLSHEVLENIPLKDGQEVRVMLAGKPLSLEYIKKKLDGHRLDELEINQIVWDIVHNKLSHIEITYFVAACYSKNMDMKETAYLTKAMVSHGDILKLDSKVVMDKHCVGGVAGNRTTAIVVPIIAAAGLYIPKTSSRSITSPAGTADTMEMLTNVTLSLDEMKKVVKKTKGCMIWGGALNLAPADDVIIKVEKPLMIDAKSQLLASVMAKKASVSATHVLIDIPYGKGSKIFSLHKAKLLKKDFEMIGKALKMNVNVQITDGKQPIGNGIGPALEARDILYTLMNHEDAPQDLKKKSIRLAGIMLEMGGKAKKGEGASLAKDILEYGLAYKKMIEIIDAQGRNTIDPKKLRLGRIRKDVKAKKSGSIIYISNAKISRIARIAGAPETTGAGVYLYVHVGNKVKKGDVLYTIFSDGKDDMKFALQETESNFPIEIR